MLQKWKSGNKIHSTLIIVYNIVKWYTFKEHTHETMLVRERLDFLKVSRPKICHLKILI